MTKSRLAEVERGQRCDGDENAEIISRIGLVVITRFKIIRRA